MRSSSGMLPATLVARRRDSVSSWRDVSSLPSIGLSESSDASEAVIGGIASFSDETLIWPGIIGELFFEFKNYLAFKKCTCNPLNHWTKRNPRGSGAIEAVVEEGREHGWFPRASFPSNPRT